MFSREYTGDNLFSFKAAEKKLRPGISVPEPIERLGRHARPDRANNEPLTTKPARHGTRYRLTAGQRILATWIVRTSVEPTILPVTKDEIATALGTNAGGYGRIPAFLAVMDIIEVGFAI